MNGKLNKQVITNYLKNKELFTCLRCFTFDLSFAVDASSK